MENKAPSPAPRKKIIIVDNMLSNRFSGIYRILLNYVSIPD
jgi:hypothetical protein